MYLSATVTISSDYTSTLPSLLRPQFQWSSKLFVPGCQHMV